MDTPYIVGIAGGSASGKTTLCQKLEQELTDYSVKVFHMDQYFKPPEERPRAKGPMTGIEYLDDNHPTTMYLPQLYKDLLAATAQPWDIYTGGGAYDAVGR